MSDEQSLEDKYAEKIVQMLVTTKRTDKAILELSVKGMLKQFLMESKA